MLTAARCLGDCQKPRIHHISHDGEDVWLTCVSCGRQFSSKERDDILAPEATKGEPMGEPKYRRVELATPLWEAWLYEDGSVTVGEVHFGRMGFERPSLHIHPEDARKLAEALAVPPSPRQLKDTANRPWESE